MLILASESPRRREILTKYLKDGSFIVLPSKADEHVLQTTPNNLAKELSKLKAYSVYETHPDDDVLACDTIVVMNDKIYGKPADEADARRMLNELSGRKHVVISAYTFINKNIEITRSVATHVTFNELSDQLIDDYIKSGSPLDKAGAYGIQDEEYHLVKEIDGSLYNVIGLPIEDIIAHLKEHLPLKQRAMLGQFSKLKQSFHSLKPKIQCHNH